MWEGRGWQRTQRQIGVAGLVALFVAEVGLNASVPIGLYSIIGGLLGLDLLLEGLGRIGGKDR